MSYHHCRYSAAGTRTARKHPACTCHYKHWEWLGSSLQLTQPLKTQACLRLGILTQVKFSLESGCNRQEWWTHMNSENIPPHLWLWANLLACTALASAHRVWVFLGTGLYRVLANTQVYSSRPVWESLDLGNCFIYLYRKGLVSKLESELKFPNFQVEPSTFQVSRLIFSPKQGHLNISLHLLRAGSEMARGDQSQGWKQQERLQQYGPCTENFPSSFLPLQTLWTDSSLNKIMPPHPSPALG